MRLPSANPFALEQAAQAITRCSLSRQATTDLAVLQRPGCAGNTDLNAAEPGRIPGLADRAIAIAHFIMKQILIGKRPEPY